MSGGKNCSAFCCQFCLLFVFFPFFLSRLKNLLSFFFVCTVSLHVRCHQVFVHWRGCSTTVLEVVKLGVQEYILSVSYTDSQRFDCPTRYGRKLWYHVFNDLALMSRFHFMSTLSTVHLTPFTIEASPGRWSPV